MKELFNKAIFTNILSSIAAAIIGLILIINPGMSIKTIAIITALYIIIHGIVLIIIDIKASKMMIPFNGFLTGLLSVILGVIFLCRPGLVSAIFVFGVGIWIILSSIDNIRLGVMLSGTDTPWVLVLLLGIVDLIAGFLVLFNPFEASLSIAVFMGMMIIIHSVMNICDMLVIKKNVSDISKSIESLQKGK